MERQGRSRAGGARTFLTVLAAATLASVAATLAGALPALQAQQAASPLTIQPDTGRVGIQTSVPSQTLDVNGTARIVDALMANGNVTVGGSLTAAGNVGIGTATPAYTLDVNGQIRATSGTAVYGLHPSCGDPSSSMTRAATCQTRVCATVEQDVNVTYYYYDCTGFCRNPFGGGRTSPATCNNTLIGRLVAP